MNGGRAVLLSMLDTEACESGCLLEGYLIPVGHYSCLIQG